MLLKVRRHHNILSDERDSRIRYNKVDSAPLDTISGAFNVYDNWLCVIPKHF